MRPLPLRGVATSSKGRASRENVIKLFNEILDQPSKDVKHKRPARPPVSREERDKTSGGLSQNESGEGIPELMKSVNRLIDVAAKTRLYPAGGWKHTETLRGSEKRIESALKSAVTHGVPLGSRQPLQALPADEDLDDLEEAAHQIRPGTFVDIRRLAPVLSQPYKHRLIPPYQRANRLDRNCA